MITVPAEKFDGRGRTVGPMEVSVNIIGDTVFLHVEKPDGNWLSNAGKYDHRGLAKAQGGRVNDTEREEWVMNNEGLYAEWRRSRIGITNWIRQNRGEIDLYIDGILDNRTGYGD